MDMTTTAVVTGQTTTGLLVVTTLDMAAKI